MTKEDRRIVSFGISIIAIIALCIVYAVYSINKEEYINQKIFGDYSYKYKQIENYQSFKFDVLELDKYNNLLKDKECNYIFAITPINYFQDGYSFQKYIFNLKCDDYSNNETIEYLVETKTFYPKIKVYNFTRYNESYVLKKELGNYSKEDFKNLTKTESFRDFLEEVNEFLEKEKTDFYSSNENIASWN